MTSAEATLTVVNTLEELGIPYMLVGLFSTSFLGIPRSTKDQGDRLDWDYVNRWADLHGTKQILDAMRQSIPPIDAV